MNLDWLPLDQDYHSYDDALIPKYFPAVVTIDLYQNDVLILNHYEILNKKKKITIKIDKPETVFKVQAISEGYKPPNTAQVQIIDGERIFELKTNLKKDENATLTIVKSVD